MEFKSDNKTIFLLLYLSVVASFIISCAPPVSEVTVSEEIDILSEPVQNNIKPEVIKTYRYRGYNWTLTAVAEYELSGIIRGIESYSLGWQAHFAPFDLCITWGDLNKTNVEKNITYSQSGRWYHFRFKAGCPVSGNYIENHASNNHIIPKNKNILKAVKSAGRRSKIKLKGYLVNLLGEKGKAKYWWNSSLSRNDGGDGSCEVFYVTEVIYAHKKYH